MLSVNVIVVIKEHSLKIGVTSLDFLSFCVNCRCNSLLVSKTKKLNSMVGARERTTPTERPPPAGEVIANFYG
jgi:hypothetical protein